MAGNATIIGIVAGLLAGGVSGIGAAMMFSQKPGEPAAQVSENQRNTDADTVSRLRSLDERLARLEQTANEAADTQRALRADIDHMLSAREKLNASGGVNADYVAALEKRLAGLESRGPASSGSQRVPAAASPEFMEAFEAAMREHEGKKRQTFDEERRDRRKQAIEREHAQLVERMKKSLGLTDNQAAQVTDILNYRRDQSLVIDYDLRPQPGDTDQSFADRKRDEMQRMNTDITSRMSSVLDAGQFEKYKAPENDLDVTDPSFGRRGFRRDFGMRRD